MDKNNITSRFNEIYSSTYKYVLTYITAKCKCTADINDIFQNTYMELYQVLYRRGTSYVTNEKGLLKTIAKRKIARYYSLVERMRHIISINTKSYNGNEIELIGLESDEFSPNELLTEDIIINQIMLDEAREFIRQKPETVKKIFYLFYDLDLTIPEIAQLLSVNESTVKNNLYRTIKELRKIYT